MKKNIIIPFVFLQKKCFNLNVFRVLRQPFKIYFLIKIRETCPPAKDSSLGLGLHLALGPVEPPLDSPGPISGAFISKDLISGNYLTTKIAKAAGSCILINLASQDLKSRRRKAQPKFFLFFLPHSLLLWGATCVGIKINYFFPHLLKVQALSLHR